jgi:hypothetical protein
MPAQLSVRSLRSRIQCFPPDRALLREGKTWRSHHEHWLGWLKNYDGPGYYGRRKGGRDAAFAYNHLHEAESLLWLAKVSGVSQRLVAVARKASRRKGSMPAQAAAVRRVIPWDLVRDALHE